VVDVQIGGAKELQAIGERLERAAGSGTLFEAVAGAVAGMLPEAQEAVSAGADRLPQRGGLAARVATTKITQRITKADNQVNVKLVAEPNAVNDPAAINRGRVRHQVYGREPRNPVIQLVPPGFFTDPLNKLAPQIRAKIQNSVREALGKV
jgi:hypothetical protein